MSYIKKISISRLAVASFMSALSIMAYGWGQKGHDTVAFIAESHLTPEAKAVAEELLDGKSIVYYSNWLDNASHTPDYAYSKTWHYKNIDADETYWNARKNPKGDVVTALEEQIAILADPTKNKDERSLALKIVTHLVGDIHQPMHMGHASDLGGNKWVIKYFNSPKNLHSVWDSSIVESGHKWSYTEWQREIDRVSPEEETAIIGSLSPEDWGLETYKIAKEIYETTPQNTNIEYNYIAKWTPVIETQFLRGGLRLAAVLNATLGDSAKVSVEAENE